ncbi:DUF2637 domain-containing protein [Streptomyces spororaveus]|uniref:DUF2637 domain-containing protein n=1 Tax=Streptomyces spororaveus TaxID=284039 RepID=UPI00378DE6E2
MTSPTDRPPRSDTMRALIGIVIAGTFVVAGIGFAGSYSAVRDLATKKGFGDFALVFPIGIDAGIVVLLALDLLLSWIRIPFPLLRQTAWLLTGATVAFNGAVAWPDPLGVGMHAVIPILFVAIVEAARHAGGHLANIAADRHMETVRLSRWLLSTGPTFKLWRRMKLWELRSYEQAVGMEQDRLIYRTQLQARYGRGWRRKAPVEALMPLRLAQHGVPLAETAPAGLAAAGIDPISWLTRPRHTTPTEVTVEREETLEEAADKAIEMISAATVSSAGLPTLSPVVPVTAALPETGSKGRRTVVTARMAAEDDDRKGPEDLPDGNSESCTEDIDNSRAANPQDSPLTPNSAPERAGDKVSTKVQVKAERAEAQPPALYGPEHTAAPGPFGTANAAREREGKERRAALANAYMAEVERAEAAGDKPPAKAVWAKDNGTSVPTLNRALGEYRLRQPTD